MNYLIFGDIHVSQTSLKECQIIFKEIIDLCNKYSVTHVISLGDNFDNNKPTASELNCLGEFIHGLGNRKIILLAAQSHESETTELSSVDIYGILSNNVKVVKEYKDSNHLYCGHFSIRESSKNYDAKLSKEDFKQYLYVFLGHVHSYQFIKPNICHLGSVRYVNFDESEDKAKIIALITDYNTDKEKVNFLKLDSPIKMVEIKLKSNKDNKLQENDSKNSFQDALQGTILDQNRDRGKDTFISKSLISQGQTYLNPYKFNDICQIISFLDKLNPKTKVKVKILDFESFRTFLSLCSKYNTKFEIFKYETQFELISDNVSNNTKTELVTFKESLTNYLKNQKIDPKITEILQKEIE